jgi:hypothetical protein
VPPVAPNVVLIELYETPVVRLYRQVAASSVVREIAVLVVLLASVVLGEPADRTGAVVSGTAEVVNVLSPEVAVFETASLEITR